MKDTNKQKDFGRRAAIVPILIGIASLLIFLILVSGKTSLTVSFFAALAIMALGNAAYLLYLRVKKNNSDEKFGKGLAQILSEVVIKMQFPMVICDKDGKIIWRNRAFADATERIGSVMGVTLDSLSSASKEDMDSGKEFSAELCQRRYMVTPLSFKTDEKNYWFFIFDDCTEIDILSEKIEEERSVVGYVLIDNLEELTQHGLNSYQAEANEVAAVLREFAAANDAILREYDRNKFMLLMSRSSLVKCCETKFDVLDRVRDVRVGDLGLSITISIGITDVGETLRQREEGAREALNMALARGGDQVAYLGNDKMEFFGGNTRPMQKRSRVAAKVRYGVLATHISRASNVIIMGHKGADQDSLGSAVGVARLAMHCFVKPYIVVDKADTNTRNFLEKFKNLPDYNDIFVDENDAQDLINSDTLLVVVDVNNIDHMLSSGIALAIDNGIIIDHHRKTDSKIKRDWLAEYIEPSASSASELVAEILEQSSAANLLLKEEADALLGGIILDTKQFTKTTGTKTLSAAIYLRSAGASIYESAAQLKSDFSEFKKQSRILASPEIYKGCYAIVSDETNSQPIDRIAAAKAAEILLSVKDIEAAFAIIRIDEDVHISARSNGNVSVQLILEKIGGGGHLDSAGAKLNCSTDEAVAKLIDAIDQYIEETEKDKNNPK